MFRPCAFILTGSSLHQSLKMSRLGVSQKNAYQMSDFLRISCNPNSASLPLNILLRPAPPFTTSGGEPREGAGAVGADGEHAPAHFWQMGLWVSLRIPAVFVSVWGAIFGPHFLHRICMDRLAVSASVCFLPYNMACCKTIQYYLSTLVKMKTERKPTLFWGGVPIF